MLHLSSRIGRVAGLLAACAVVSLAGSSRAHASTTTVTSSTANQTVTAPSPTRSDEQKAAADCRQGDALSHAGLDTEAQTAYESALSAAWDARCATTGLGHIPNGWAERAADNVVAALPTVLVGVAAVCVLAFIALLVGYVPVLGFWFQTHVPWRWALHPRMSLAPLNTDALAADGNIGDAMMSRIRERLQSFRTDALDQTGTDTGWTAAPAIRR